MRDPKADAAPYRAEYAAWDYWAYQHACDQQSPEFQQLISAGLPADWIWYYAGVDKQGNLLPMLSNMREELELQYGLRQPGSDAACSFRLLSAGPMPAALKNKFVTARSSLRAEFCPAVPQWLAEAPPRHALLLDGGQVVALGEAGSGKDTMQATLWGRPETGADHWHLFGADGGLIREGEPGGQWWHLSFADYATVLQLDQPGLQCYEWNGIISVYDNVNYELKGAYLYDGTRLGGPGEYSYLATSKPLEGFDGYELPLIYKAQRKLQR